MEYLIIKSSKTNKFYKLSYFKSYFVDQSTTVPADFFNFTFSDIKGEIATKISAGDEVFFYVNNKLVLNGITDDFNFFGRESGHEVEINGRDKTSLLLDNDANPLTLYRLNLKQYLEKQIVKYGITKFDVSNLEVFDKVVISPGETEWGIIERLSKSKGLYPRYDVDILRCTSLRSDSNFDYHFSNDLLQNTIKMKNFNIKVSSDIKNEVIVYGGNYSRGEFVNSSNIKGSYKDSNITFTKKRVINDDELESISQANNLAKEELKKLNRNGFTIAIETHTKMPIYLNKVAKVTIMNLGLECLMLVDKVQYIKNENGSVNKIDLKLMDNISVSWGNHSIPFIPR